MIASGFLDCVLLHLDVQQKYVQEFDCILISNRLLESLVIMAFQLKW